MFSDVWSENAALLERLMEIHSNPPILYYMALIHYFHRTPPPPICKYCNIFNTSIFIPT